ncbi:uncharacterized protein M421DRAFT_6670 [Didymella exigua CBS 183.55]|uniref:Uncharacterized protein n=1 Tax=Didymella exigua CBS 183.55 TaxID=1150837 RepID=A0A6A5RI43_9PLEO|nr:uncharacterized protein M421DRAFT_6670 [Didymella exigua CBS 183.55]KAF1926758.1 hypothetical protein M421DRAFT_6670 [Didymella exigua CBS 183.55]
MLFNKDADKEKIEFRLRSDSKKMPNLHDLGRLLGLSNRLKEMGTSFTSNGKMQTYGNPPLHEDLEQMLHGGVEYDELWHAFFNGRNHVVETQLWPILRVLKRMLQNEGIAFDDHHTRLDYGSALPKLIRLSDQYDLLRDEWFEKTLSDIHPALRWHQAPAHVGVPITPTIKGRLFTKDKLPENEIARKKSRRAKCLTIIAEKQSGLHKGLGPTIREAEDTYLSPPDRPEEMVSTTISILTTSYEPASAYPDGLTTAGPLLIHGSSPLQCANTASMLLVDDAADTRTNSTESSANRELLRCGPQQCGHAGVLGWLVEDERRRTENRQRHADEEQQRAYVPGAEEEKNTSSKKNKRSKRIRKWLRIIFGLKKHGEQQ